MDNKHDILALLRAVAEGSASPEDALLELKRSPFEDLGYAKVDYHRSVRQGAGEMRVIRMLAHPRPAMAETMPRICSGVLPAP